MAGWDGNGNFVRSDGTRTGMQVWQDAKTAGVKIRADDHDTHDQEIADGLENTVALDGQTTTTTDNAILRFDSGTNKFEGVTISASQVVGRGSSGDVKGINVASARALLGLGSATPTNDQALFWSSASSQYVQATAATARSLIGLGTASPTNNKALFYSSSSSQYTQRNAAELATASPTNNRGLFYASSTSTFKQTTGVPLVGPTSSSDPGLAFDTWRTPNNNRPTFVIIDLRVGTDGNTNGIIHISVDESGGTSEDYVVSGAFILSAVGADTQRDSASIFVPAGGSYRINNFIDPDNANTIDDVREFTL